MFTKSALLSFLAVASIASAAPTEKRADLQPWQITSAGSFSPSGRPGSYPWLTITSNITDPNEITLGKSESDGSDVTVPAGNVGGNCQAKWLMGTSPLDHAWPCDPSGDGWWIMEVVKGDNGDFSTTNFGLKFTRVAEVLYQGSRYSKKFEGTAQLKVGDNMSGTCGGSGVCSWGLKAESKPLLVEQKEVSA
ncbi:hypothetical protein EJ04DRAFT_111426 [Polyplosphaeria fusca]|uniref:Cell death in tomato 1 n=1 Tax=Polyplosphaeria fusca TaxID=682080 RepID=A0A9P4R829_9PLEO|nr:hypothetical protein EJ04DRAFT_111426 [Polyplosphaeria fusca]